MGATKKPVLDCKPCYNGRTTREARERRAQNPEKAKADFKKHRSRKTPEQRRQYQLRSQYGIDMADYDNMLASQGGCCAICRVDEPGVKRKYFSVDHCHDTGEVRGLLCTQCNSGLGLFKDDLDILESAVGYLSRFKIREVGSSLGASQLSS